MSADGAPSWFAAFVNDQFSVLASNVAESSKQLTSQVTQIDGILAALEITVQSLQSKQQESERHI
eukprot:5442438-Pyramimonas_sp.AAC.1